MRKYVVGIIAGAVGAIINVTFLLFAPGLDRNVYLSTGITWLTIGLLVSACNFKLNGIVKGMVVALLVSSSSLVYTFSSSLSGGLWTVVNTIIVGGILGFVIDKLSDKVAKKNEQ